MSDSEHTHDNRYTSIWVQESHLTGRWIGRTSRQDSDIIFQILGGSGFVVDEYATVTEVREGESFFLSAGTEYAFCADVTRISMVYCEISATKGFEQRSCRASTADQTEMRSWLTRLRVAVAQEGGPVTSAGLIADFGAAIERTFERASPLPRCGDEIVALVVKIHSGEFDGVGEAGLLGALVGASGLSARTIQQRFKKSLGLSPSEYFRGARLDRASKALVATDGPTQYGGLARRLGFQNTSRFATYYENRFAERPLDTIWRRSTL